MLHKVDTCCIFSVLELFCRKVFKLILHKGGIILLAAENNEVKSSFSSYKKLSASSSWISNWMTKSLNLKVTLHSFLRLFCRSFQDIPDCEHSNESCLGVFKDLTVFCCTELTGWL